MTNHDLMARPIGRTDNPLPEEHPMWDTRKAIGDAARGSAMDTNEVRISEELPCLGRHQELDRLEKLLEQVRAGVGKVIRVRGQSGVGKSRLVNEFVSVPVHGDLRRGEARCTTQLVEPFLPFRRLLSHLGSQEWAAPGVPQAIDEFLENLTDGSTDMGPDVRSRIFMRTTQLLTELAAGQPLVLILDDVQWADELSATYLQHLASEVHDISHGCPLMIIVIERTDDQPSSQHVLDTKGEVLELAPLTAAVSERLIFEVTGFVPSPSTLDAINLGTNGNPLLIIESLRSAVTRNRIGVTQGRLEASPGFASGAPTILGEVLAATVSQLQPSTQSMLRAAALTRHEFDKESLSRLFHSRSPTELQQSLDESVAHGLLTLDGGLYRFRHPAIRQTLIATTHRAEADLIRAAEAAEVLSGSPTGASMLRAAAQLARLDDASVASSIDGRDVLASAARQSAVMGAWIEATHWAAMALNFPRGANPRNADGWLHYEAGRNAELACQWETASHHFDCALKSGRDTQDAALTAWSTISSIHASTVAGGRFSSTLRLSDLVDALENLTVPTLEAVVARTQLSQAFAASGQLDRAESLADEALQLAVLSGDLGAQLRVEMTAGLVKLYQVDLRAAAVRYVNGCDLARKTDDQLRLGHGLSRLALIRLVGGQFDDFELSVAEATAVNRATRQWGDLAFLAALQAQAALLRGDIASVERLVRKGHHFLGLADYPFAPGLLYPILVSARNEVHDYDGALDAVDDWSRATGKSYASMQQEIRRLVDGKVGHADHRLWLRRPGLADLARMLVDLEHPSPTLKLTARRRSTIADIEARGVRFAPGSDVGVLRSLAEETAAAGSEREALDLADRAVADAERHGLDLERARSMLTRCRLTAASDRAGAYEDACRALRLADSLGATTTAANLRDFIATVRPQARTADPHLIEDERIIVFVDMVGSTAISVRSNRMYIDLIDDEFQIARRRILETGGSEFGVAGDAILAWFYEPDDAIQCARAIQRDVDLVTRPAGSQRLQVAIGVGEGPVIQRDNQLYGAAVNLSARLSDLAGPGEIVVAREILDRCAERPQVSLAEEHTLKGFTAGSIATVRITTAAQWNRVRETNRR